jgi:hypothetical protein
VIFEYEPVARHFSTRARLITTNSFLLAISGAARVTSQFFESDRLQGATARIVSWVPKALRWPETLSIPG